MAILKRLKTFSFRKTRSKIRNTCDYILNMLKKRQRFLITEAGFPIRVILFVVRIWKHIRILENTSYFRK